MVCATSYGQVSESFESGLPTSYTSTLANATLGSGTWQIQDVIAGSTGIQTGTKSAQIRSATAAQIISPTLTGGVGTISFYVTASTTSGAYQVNISTDNGVSWTAATGSPFTISTTKTLRTITLNNSSVNKIQIYRTGATIYIDDFNTTTYSVTPTITLADNGTVAAANVNQGTTNHVLHKFSLAVTTANATLSGITATTAGTYAAADITNLKVRYSTDATLDSGDATLSTAVNPGVAGSKTFPSFTSQAINSGSTGYIFITADISGTAVAGNTISVNAVTTAQLTFSSGNKSGSTTAAGAQTFTAATPVITVSDNGTAIAAANVNQGASNQILAAFKADVTTANATLTDANIYFDGTYTASDIVASGLRLWYNTTNNIGTATMLQSRTATGSAGGGEIVSFTGLSQTVAIGTRFFWVTANLSATATAGNTIRVLSVVNTDVLFSSGTKSGSATISGVQTIVTATPAITLADNGTQVTAANVNLSTLNHVLHKFSLAVTTNSATLTGIQVTTTGTYITADLTNLKVRYSTDATLDAGDATLSTYTSVPTAGILTFPSFASQLIGSGTTGFIFITADIAATAVAGNTIGVNAVTTAQVSFSVATTKTGSTAAAGLQTVAAPTVVIWANTITGTNPNTSNPYITGDTVVSNITVSGIGRGSGITGANANNRYNASGWNTGALDANDYFEFTLSPNSGYKINLTNFVYTGQISTSGSQSFAFRSSVDGYVNDIGTPTTSGTTISLAAAAYQNVVTPITFRYYAFNVTSGATYSINDFTFNGSVSVAGPTLVTSAATLSSFSYVAGAGPSSSQTFNLSGVSLTGFPADVTVNGSANYEVSTDNSSFGASRTVAYTSATLAATPIYVRLKAGLIAGTYNAETISISGGGATAVNVTCNGSVIPPFFRSRNTTGNWATASDWESSADNSSWATAGQVPTAAATAITIQGTHNMSITSGSVSADDITVATGGTLTISGGTFTLNNGDATNDLQINGTLTCSGGTFTQGASGVAFGANATYNHALAASTIPLATWDATSTCVVTGATGALPGNIAQNYGNFTWNCTGQTTFLNVNNNAFQVRGLFRLLSTGSASNTFTMASTVAGTYANTINAASIEGGVLAIAFTSGVTSTTTITTDLIISGGEVRINGSAGVGTLNVGRDLIMSGTGFLNPLFASNSPSTTITVGRDLIMSGNAYIDFEFTNTTSSSSVINVGRNFTSTSAGDATNFVILDFGGSTTSGIVAGNTLNIAGNFSHTGTGKMQTFSQNAPTGIVFSGSGIQTFTYTTAGALDWVPITINTGSTVQLQNSFSIGQDTVGPFITITVNGTLDFQNFSISAGNSTIPQFNTSAGATLITANTAGIGGTGATGSLRGFSTVAATAPANGKIVFLAGTNYTFNGATTTPFPTTFGNPATINVNAAISSNMTSGLTVTSAFNVNNGGTFTLNPTTNSLTLNNNAALTINTGGTFDNGGENQIFNGGGSPTINISGTFITKDVQGFVGDNTAIPGITPTLNTSSTVEYGFAGNQAVQGGRSYNNITISNGGIKTLSSAITSGNTITGTVTIKDASILNVGDKTFGGAGTNLTMTGTAEYQTAGIGTKPDAEGAYNLGVGTKMTFTNNLNTLQAIKLSSPVVNYYNIDIVGNNVGTTALGTGSPTTNIKMQSGGTFTVKSTGTFKHSNTAGFSGTAFTAIDNTNTPIITLENGSTIEYAGANQTITPFTNTIVPAPSYTDSNRSYSNLVISGTGTKNITASSEILVGNELLVTGGTLQMDSNKLLTVNNAIKNTSGNPIIVKNSGNLVQIANVDNATTNANTGNITMTRTSRNMPNVYDYIYWGSPVKGNVFSQIPSSVYDVSYYWKLTGAAEGFWDPLSTTIPGQGFISRVKPGGTGAKDFDFTGIPNNGTVLVAADGYDTDFNLDTTGNTILLANPYPCAIDAEAFIDANGLLDGNLYFWTASTVPGDYYQQDDYATWNRSGSVGTKATTDSSENDNLKPSGKIAAGQGFFADFHADGNVTFNNAMRIRNSTDNSQFFKTTKSNKVNQQKSRVWLNLFNSKKAFRQMLVAYVSNATNGFDRSYDAESFTANEIDIYSIVENKSLVIQGRALPLDDADVVPIGIAITNAGEYNIAIDAVDGLMTNKAIYLEDKLLNKTHNLTEGAYTFTTASGTFNNRFVLRYTDATLGTKDPKLVENQVLVFTKDKKIKVNSATENINTVTVYDLLGRQLFKNNKVNNKEFTLSNLVAKQQMLLVKVLLDNGETLTKKVLF